MGAKDMVGSDFDSDASRYNRMNRTQQPEYAPGMDDIFNNDTNNVFSQSTVQNPTTQMGDIFNQPIGGMGMQQQQPSNNSFQQQQMQQPQDDADKFWNVVGNGFKSAKNFVSDIAGTFQYLTPLWYYKFTGKVAVVSLAVTVISFVARLFGLDFGLQIAIGGLLSCGAASIAFFALYSSANNCKAMYKDGTGSGQGGQNQQPMQQQQPQGFDFGMNDFGSDPFADSQGGGGDFDFGFSNDDSSSFGGDDFGGGSSDDDDDIYGDDDEYIAESNDQPQEGMNADDALASMPDVPKGMYERSYLFDTFIKVLPTMQPNFAELRVIDEDSDTFLAWGDNLIEAAQVSGCKEDNLPELTMLQENLFTIIVTCTRPQNCKPDVIANELANIYAYNKKTGEKNENVFAKVDTIGATIKITIFSGAAVMISVKDMLLHEKQFFLDTKNYMPVVIGVNQLGKVIEVDFKKLESIIVTGMPRAGKSWFVQAVLTQMCAFVPPSELNIYICDPKEGISDYKSFVLPHVKKFVTEDDKIVQTLRNLVKIEGPRRKKIIGDANFVNIWDYKDRNPDVKLPIIYVVIDEVVTLASRMDKETNNEFRMLLRELISQMPALGIRAILMPHILNNEIIEKKTSDLVPCKISVLGNADHIEKATGSKFKDFPYRLVNKGDMAVKLTGFHDTLFVHAPVLTDDNSKNSALFDYMRRVWAKLEPEETSEISESAEDSKQISSAKSAIDASDYDPFGDDEVLNIF